MRIIFTAALTLIVKSALAQTAPVLPLPPDWYPESLAAGPDGSLYAGSWRQGAVARLSADGRRADVLVPPGAGGLANGQGVLVDAQAGLLWVCSGNLGHTTVPVTPSALKSYDLRTGAPQASYPLPDAGYCNDLAQDSRGTLYVTDSRHPRVLRLRRGDTALATWAEHPAFQAGAEGYSLNGIALDGDGKLYVTLVTAVPYLLRIAVDDAGRAGQPERIAMPRVLKNADAIRVYGPDRIAVFESNAFGHDGPYGGQVSVARVRGATATLRTVAAGLNDPSSGIVKDGRIWFIESKYGLLLGAQDRAVPAGVPFDVQSVPLPPDEEARSGAPRVPAASRSPSAAPASSPAPADTRTAAGN